MVPSATSNARSEFLGCGSKLACKQLDVTPVDRQRPRSNAAASGETSSPISSPRSRSSDPRTASGPALHAGLRPASVPELSSSLVALLGSGRAFKKRTTQ
jgi:hypothetical protein